METQSCRPSRLVAPAIQQTSSCVGSDFKLRLVARSSAGPPSIWRGSLRRIHGCRFLTFTKSHPRNLLSIARSKSARSRIRPSRSRKKRIDQIWRTCKARFAPTCLPAFQAGHTAAAGSHCEIPLHFSIGRSGRWINDYGLRAGGKCRPHFRHPRTTGCVPKAVIRFIALGSKERRVGRLSWTVDSR